MADAEEAIDFGESEGASEPWTAPEPRSSGTDDGTIDWGVVDENDAASEPRRKRPRLFHSWRF